MIICFSGTGNSRLVASRLNGLLGDAITTIDASTLLQRQTFAAERVIWVFPIYSWGVPPVVKAFIDHVELNDDSLHYMVCTCGDDIGLAHKMWRNDIARRGWKSVATYSVQMPNNYVSLPGFDVDSPELAASKIEKARERVSHIGENIKNGIQTDDVVTGGFPWIKSRIINPWFMKFEMSPKPFHYTNACIGCGKCAKVCPMNNVAIKNSRPEWGRECAMCLACYHICPCHAVAYGNRTVKKGQYFAKQLNL